MIQDLKLDSQRWQQEQGRQEAGRGGSPYVRDSKLSRQPDASLVAYQDSRTHAARQHWGPSESMSQGREQDSRRTGHSSSQQYASSDHYTAAPTSSYGGPAGYAPQQSYAAAPRTQPDPYAAYAQPGREHPSYASTQQYPGYSQPTTQEPYRAQPPPPTHGYTQPRYFGYFDEHYLVYR